MDALRGKWKVKRLGGLVPTLGLRKRISDTKGWTLLGRLPVAPFRVEGHTLRYRGLPVKDVLVDGDAHGWVGRTYLFGMIRLGSFRLEPL